MSNKERGKMKQIRRYNNETGKYEAISQGYSGLSGTDAKNNIAQLRRWSKEDNSGAKYKIVDVELIPV